MEKIFHKIPFLRFVIALAIGIIIGSVTSALAPIVLPLLLFSFVITALLNVHYNYKLQFFYGVSLNICIILLGVFIHNEYNRVDDIELADKSVAIVLEKPQEKLNSFRSVIQIETLVNDKSHRVFKQKVLTYFEKSKKVGELNSGDRIFLDQEPQLIKNAGNPYEFDYKSYLQRKKIYHQIYLPDHSWVKAKTQADFTIGIWAERVREHLLEIYRSQKLDATELDILSALTLGYKRELDPEVKKVFSEAGAMHVLAVSGLHVGIIFLVINIFLGFLKKQKYGRPVFVLVALFILWSYAFVTGLSPSVSRAAIMFSLFLIGDSTSRQINTYNTLAASAFLLLLINPNNLFEVGFQLSYAAVTGIVFLQPKLYKLILVKNRILQYVWGLFTVSVAAQIATFPITSYYFGQFPSYFWITNLIVIPAVMILIPLGIALLILSKIQILSSVIALVLNILIKMVYGVLKGIQQLPFSVIDITVTQLQVLFIISTILLLFVFFESKQKKFLTYSLLGMIFVFLIPLISKSIGYSKREIIIYNNQTNSIVHLMAGKKNYVISESIINKNDFALNIIKNTCKKRNLSDPVFMIWEDSQKDDLLWLKNNILVFEGKIISFKKDELSLPSHFKPDYIINPGKLFLNDKKYGKIIITDKRFLYQQNADSVHNFHITDMGAFIDSW